MINRRLQLRIAAASAFLYMLAFVGLQFLLPQMLSGDQLHTPANASIDQSVTTLMRFVQRHASYFGMGYVLVALTYLLLIGPLLGTLLLIYPARPRTARMVGCIGLLGIVGITVAQILTATQLLDWSSRFNRATTAGARRSAVHGFEQVYGGYQIANLVLLTTLALWLALLGVTFLRLQGTRSLVGWATVAAGILLLSQFPSLPVWALGAAVGLWRLSDRSAAMQTGLVIDAPEAAPRAELAPARRSAAGGSKARKRPSSKHRRR